MQLRKICSNGEEFIMTALLKLHLKRFKNLFHLMRLLFFISGKSKFFFCESICHVEKKVICVLFKWNLTVSVMKENLKSCNKLLMFNLEKRRYLLKVQL